MQAFCNSLSACRPCMQETDADAAVEQLSGLGAAGNADAKVFMHAVFGEQRRRRLTAMFRQQSVEQGGIMLEQVCRTTCYATMRAMLTEV